MGESVIPCSHNIRIIDTPEHQSPFKIGIPGSAFNQRYNFGHLLIPDKQVFLYLSFRFHILSRRSFLKRFSALLSQKLGIENEEFITLQYSVQNVCQVWKNCVSVTKIGLQVECIIRNFNHKETQLSILGHRTH